MNGPPVPGLVYRVPCIRVDRQGYSGWVPILGPAHSDPELGLREPHYHYDLRFISERQFRRLFKSRLFTSHKPSPERDRWALGVLEDAGNVLDGPVLRPLVCRRVMPEFVPYGLITPRGAQGFARIEEQHRGCRLKCRTCPHRGFDLSSVTPNERGEIVCPGHGLRWSAATGELIPQLAREEAVCPG